MKFLEKSNKKLGRTIRLESVLPNLKLLITSNSAQ